MKGVGLGRGLINILIVGSEFKDDVVDIMSYFSGTVYKGFGDDPNVCNICTCTCKF